MGFFPLYGLLLYVLNKPTSTAKLTIAKVCRGWEGCCCRIGGLSFCCAVAFLIAYLPALPKALILCL